MRSKIVLLAASAVIIIVISAIILLGEGFPGPVEEGTGTVSGNVTIGPIMPVERPGVTPSVNPDVFLSRKLVVYDKDGTTAICEIDIVPAGHYGTYQASLKPGTYVLDIKPLGVDRADGLPAAFEIVEGRTTVIDVNIDTGIR
ncbi:hypothetical protein CUJ83_04400 [Methanocella sp. CWC-04]|uniref:Carboxypeptidase regulatory-like domain-containing protein n=1 Tax=Methanooceanicella nereidis TaxID=2052831 RepID=A0AAP2W6L4_9EURY|nr:hypothetical protein [Methanocella sp. CWC-04]MCD1294236.1 hypothetical protein [Methanocella sp. CWC-04]